MFLSSKFLSTLTKTPIGFLRLNSISLVPRPYNTFWKFWKKNKQEQNGEKKQVKKYVASDEMNPTYYEDDEPTDFTKEKNLGFIVEKIYEDNLKKSLLLPPKDPRFEGKKTLVVEMDETLLYTFYPDEHEAYLLAPSRDYDHYVDLPEHQTFISIYTRNHLKEFLSYVKENFEPVLFCNGMKEYVDKVMDIIDKEKVFVHRIYQESCDKIVDEDENLNELTKDLHRLNRDLSQTILVDARPFNLWCCPDNCIPIKQYQGDSVDVDKELLVVMDVLDEVKEADDVRPFLKEKYGIRNILKETNLL